jgi:hypothetical protein
MKKKNHGKKEGLQETAVSTENITIENLSWTKSQRQRFKRESGKKRPVVSGLVRILPEEKNLVNCLSMITVKERGTRNEEGENRDDKKRVSGLAGHIIMAEKLQSVAAGSGSSSTLFPRSLNHKHTRHLIP